VRRVIYNSEENKLKVFVSKVQRKLFRPKREWESEGIT